MGLTTVTAARILRGQKQGHSGEDAELAFEKFPYVALAKTYNVDSQIGDSAACATALLCGVKGRLETLGLEDKGQVEKCGSSFDSRVPCLMEWAQIEGKATGFVTNTRVTHATPAALFAHITNRYWEDDSKIPEDERHNCKDIARQLIEDEPGRHINVIMGGGRRHFLQNNYRDFRHSSDYGKRKDGRNLINAWIQDKETRELPYRYVSTAEELDLVDTSRIDYLLGLFAHSHMDFDGERSAQNQPSLVDMTKKAIEILRKNPHGYFLMVESGRIDHAHHYNNAYRALHEVLTLDETVATAIALTSPNETLIVVTADHSHVFSFGGLAKRGNPIFGLDNKLSDIDQMPYTTLLYANGPGYDRSYNGQRPNISDIDTAEKDYVQQAAVPRRWETHGGEDVPAYAMGPMAHLFQGVVEQTYIPHAISYAACMAHYKHQCITRLHEELQKNCQMTSSATVTRWAWFTQLIVGLMLWTILSCRKKYS
ncbi:hypothetical protein CHUAL_001392 [Chamberlinius hualienensis]